MMSSEESGSDDTIVVRTLRWRSHRVNHTFHKIRNFILGSQSPQAIRQLKSWKISSIVLRQEPLADMPKWAIKDTK